MSLVYDAAVRLPCGAGPIERLALRIAARLAARREAMTRRTLAALPPQIQRDIGITPAGQPARPDVRSFDHNSPVGSPGAYW